MDANRLGFCLGSFLLFCFKLGQDGSSDTFSFGKCNLGFLFLSDDKDVVHSCGEGLSNGISDVNNVERSWVSFSVYNNSNSTQVTASSAHNKRSNFEFQNLGDFAGGQVEFYSVVGFDDGIRVSDSSSVVESSIRNSLDSFVDFSNSAEFELKGIIKPINYGNLRFFCINGVNGESSLGIVQKSEIFIGLFNGHNICGKGVKFENNESNLPMKPAGYRGSVRTLPSTLMARCFMMYLTSFLVRAYFNLFLNRRMRGRDSRYRWGPETGLGAYFNLH